MTKRRIAFVVHDHDQAASVAETAAATKTPVWMVSPRQGAASLGADVFRVIIDDARNAFPEADIVAVLDCGDRAGLALQAVRQGVGAISVTVPAELRRRFEEIAARSGTALVDAASDAVDLAATDDAPAAVRRRMSDSG